jgi:hypothetical protein
MGVPLLTAYPCIPPTTFVKVLSDDVHWCELLKLCVSKGAYTGVPLPPNIFDDEDVAVAGTEGAEGEEEAALLDEMYSAWLFSVGVRSYVLLGFDGTC